MHPILLKLGPITLSSYGALLALAFLLAIGMARHVTRRSLRTSVPMQDAALMDWAGWTVIGGLLGGRVLYLILNWEVYARQPLEMFAIWHGGLVWYGGFFGGMLATVWYLKAHGIAALRGLDQVIPFVALGHAVGRIGCLMNGCCFGKPTGLWCGIWLPGQKQPVIPTQLLESLGLVALYLLLRRLQTPAVLQRPRDMRSMSGTESWKSRSRDFSGPGRVFGSYLIGYAVIRGLLEFWRADQPLVWAGLTLHQLISLGLLLFGAGLLLRRPRQAVSSPS